MKVIAICLEREGEEREFDTNMVVVGRERERECVCLDLTVYLEVRQVFIGSAYFYGFSFFLFFLPFFKNINCTNVPFGINSIISDHLFL